VLQEHSKTFKNREKEAAKRQVLRIVPVRCGTILCRMKLETLGKEITFYCLTVIVSKKIELCVHTL